MPSSMRNISNIKYILRKLDFSVDVYVKRGPNVDKRKRLSPATEFSSVPEHNSFQRLEVFIVTRFSIFRSYTSLWDNRLKLLI